MPFTTARGPGKNVVTNAITIDLSKGVTSKKGTSASLSKGVTYRVTYRYDAKAGIWRLTISGGGKIKVDISKAITGPIDTLQGKWEMKFSDRSSKSTCRPTAGTTAICCSSSDRERVRLAPLDLASPSRHPGVCSTA